MDIRMAPEANTSPLGSCPACGSAAFTAVSNGVDVNYRCDTCWWCWNVSYGRASVVDPASCPSCTGAGRCRGAPLRVPAVSGGPALTPATCRSTPLER